MYGNITKWVGGSLEEITRDSRDRARWRILARGAARAVDHHSWSDRERRSEDSEECCDILPQNVFVVSWFPQAFLIRSTVHHYLEHANNTLGFTIVDEMIQRSCLGFYPIGTSLNPQILSKQTKDRCPIRGSPVGPSWWITDRRYWLLYRMLGNSSIEWRWNVRHNTLWYVSLFSSNKK